MQELRTRGDGVQVPLEAMDVDFLPLICHLSKGSQDRDDEPALLGVRHQGELPNLSSVPESNVTAF